MSRIEYPIPTNNTVVLDSYFNLTNMSYLIHRLWYDLIRFFDHMVMAYFFGPPCITPSVMPLPIHFAFKYVALAGRVIVRTLAHGPLLSSCRVIYSSMFPYIGHKTLDKLDMRPTRRQTKQHAQITSVYTHAIDAIHLLPVPVTRDLNLIIGKVMSDSVFRRSYFSALVTSEINSRRQVFDSALSPNTSIAVASRPPHLLFKLTNDSVRRRRRSARVWHVLQTRWLLRVRFPTTHTRAVRSFFTTFQCHSAGRYIVA